MDKKEQSKAEIKKLVEDAVEDIKDGVEFQKLVELPAFKKLELEWQAIVKEFREEKSEIPYENFATGARILVGRDSETNNPQYISGQEYLGLRMLEEIRVNVYDTILYNIHDRVTRGKEAEEKLRKYNQVKEASKKIQESSNK